VLFSTALVAQPAYFGGRASLTNTRYATTAAVPLATDSSDVTFWSTAHNIRVSRGNDVALAVLEASGDGDVVWSGARFLVAATAVDTIVGRLLDAQGSPTSDTFEIMKQASKPRLASDGDRVLMLYTSGGTLRVVVLNREGLPAAAPQTLAIDVVDYDVAPNAALIATKEAVKLLTLTRDGAIATETRVADAAEHVALASNANQLLGIWSRGGKAEAAVLSGGAIQPFAIDGHSIASLSLAGTGSGYRAAYLDGGAARMLSLNAGAREGGGATSPAMLGAAEQSLAASASTPLATLVAWNEGTDAHVGIRTANGGWTESLLARGERAVAASSDGREFIVVTANASGWSATLLDANGNVLRQSSRVAFDARGVASSASAHAVIGIDVNGNVVASRVNVDGSASAPVIVRAAAEDPAIASDGVNFFAVWQAAEMRVEGARLNGDLQRMDAADVLIWEDKAEDPVVAFTGNRYMVAFRSGAFVKGRRVTREGVAMMESLQTGRLDALPPTQLAVARLGELTGVSWFDGKAQLLLLDNAWEVKAATAFRARGGSAPRLVALPNNGIGFAHSDVVADAPHHGSTRVLLSVATDARPQAPDAPRATATNASGRVRVDWTVPPQAVSGYRVEYRIDEGAWVEAEGSNAATATSMMFDPKRSGTYAIRVRAIGDGGVSAYSEPVTITVTAGRRRAVR
jgi:hypothetical protein